MAPKNEQPALMMVDPKLIDVRKGFNPRMVMSGIDRLIAQIKEVKSKDPRTGGLLQNLNVKPKANGRFEVVDGERRYTAISQMIKEGEDFPFGIPVKLVRGDQSEVDSLVQAFIANESLPFLPIERGNAFKRMKAAGMTIAAIEKATGISDNTILDEMALVDAAPELQKAVKEKKVSATVAKKIAVTAKGDTAKQKKLTKQAIAAKGDAKKTDALAQEIEKTRRTKAASKGRTLKLQPISKVQLTELGMKAERYLKTKLKEAQLDIAMTTEDMREWTAKTNDRAAAYQYGVMDALKAVAGIKVNLDI